MTRHLRCLAHWILCLIEEPRTSNNLPGRGEQDGVKRSTVFFLSRMSFRYIGGKAEGAHELLEHPDQQISKRGRDDVESGTKIKLNDRHEGEWKGYDTK